MGNTGQVVAALAGGGLLGVAIALVFQLYGAGSRHDPSRSDGRTDRERRIRQAAEISADVAYEILQKRNFTDEPWIHGADDRLPHLAEGTRPRRHLTVLDSSEGWSPTQRRAAAKR